MQAWPRWVAIFSVKLSLSLIVSLSFFHAMILNLFWCHPYTTFFVAQATLLMQELCRRTFRPSICRMKVQLVGTRAGILQCSGFQFAQTSFDCSPKGRYRVASSFTQSRDVIANRESPSTVCALERRFTQRGHARLGAKTVQNTSSWTYCHVLTRNRFVHSETLHVNELNAVKPFIRLQDIRNRSVRPDGFFDSWDVRTCFARPLRWMTHFSGRLKSCSIQAPRWLAFSSWTRGYQTYCSRNICRYCLDCTCQLRWLNKHY